MIQIVYIAGEKRSFGVLPITLLGVIPALDKTYQTILFVGADHTLADVDVKAVSGERMRRAVPSAGRQILFMRAGIGF